MENQKVSIAPLEVEVVYGEYPPNIDQIQAVFPMAMKDGVIFAYGRKVFVPSGRKIPPEILAHERIHCERQIDMGVEEWWTQYMADPVFRYHEELLAHRVEYSFLRGLYPGQDAKHRALEHVATKLAHPLYGGLVSKKRAKEDLKA